MTCLMKAAMSGHLEVVELLLTYGANPRITNPKGETALSLAILEEKIGVCERLLVAKSDPMQKDSTGRTLFHKATIKNQGLEILKILHRFGADPNMPDQDFNTPLHYAAQKGVIELGQYLLSITTHAYSINSEGLFPYEVVSEKK